MGSSTPDAGSAPIARDAAGEPALPDATAPDSGSSLPDAAQLTACTASNYLDRDSFEVVAAAIVACMQGQPMATCSSSATSMSLGGLAQGVAPIVFDYATTGDGSHTLVGHGQPGVAPAPPGIVFEASGIPAAIGLDAALQSFYVAAMPSFPCAWN